MLRFKYLSGLLTFVLLLSFSFSFSQDVVSVRGADSQSVMIDFKMPEYKFVKKVHEHGNYFLIETPGFFPSLNAGEPQIPVLRKLMEVPASAEFKVEILNAVYKTINLEELEITEKFLPHQPSHFKTEQAPGFQQNDAVYSADEFYELEAVQIQYLGILRDVAMARLSISPVRYNPVTNQVKIMTSAKVKIEYKNYNKSLHQKLKNKGSSVYFRQLSSNMLSGTANQRDSLANTPAKYIIVADTMFRSSLQPFVRWKTQKGFQVVEAYLSDPAVGNTAPSIQNYLQEHYDNATPTDPAPSFVLLVGDIAEMPYFYGKTASHPTDMYFAEYTGDTIPDAYFGRFSASDTAELNVQIRKTLAYEKYLMPQPSYLDNAVLIAGADGTYGPVHGNGQINYINNEYINTAAGFNANVFLYPNSSSQVNQIYQDLTNGFAIANYTAHGISYGWADPQLYNSDLHNVQNVGKYGLMIGNACLTNKFDEPSCFGEAVMQLDNRGAIGYIGGTNSTLWDEDYYWSVGITSNINANPLYSNTTNAAYDKLFHTHGQPFSQWYTTQGQMIFSGNLSVEASASSQNKYYWEIYALMGDPSLMPYLGVPQQTTASFSNVLPIGSSQMQVSTNSYATVALSMNDTLIATALADQSGNAQLSFPALTTPGSALLVITSQNHQPYIDTVNVLNPNGPYIIHQDYVLNDSLGNNNGKADYGEKIFLDEVLKNYTSYSATNVTATVTTADTNVTILDNSETWSSVSGNTQITAKNAFGIQVKNKIPDNHYVTFDVEITDGQSNVWNSSFKILLHAPKLKLLQGTLVEINGNGDGIVDGGETARFKAKLVNSGSADADVVASALLSSSADVTISGASSKTHGSLSSKASVMIEYDLNISHSAWRGTLFSLDLETDAGQYADQNTYTFMVGQAQEDFESGDFSSFDWQHNSNYNWTMDNQNVIAGSYTARSNDGLPNLSESELSISMETMEDDSVSFLYRVSSEGGYDFLEFWVDNNQLGQWSGIQSKWAKASFFVPKGAHTFTWKYTKDYGWAEGDDCAWIDNITFPANDLFSSIKDVNSNKSIQVFPNPATTQLNILSDDDMMMVHLYDLSGRTIISEHTHTPNNTVINTSKLNDGIYILSIQLQSGAVENRKVVIR